MDKKRTDDDLPKWFIIMSKIANHFSYGLIVVFYLINTDWSSKHFAQGLINWVNYFLVMIGVPTAIFSGANIFTTIIKIISALKK